MKLSLKSMYTHVQETYKEKVTNIGN